MTRDLNTYSLNLYKIVPEKVTASTLEKKKSGEFQSRD